MKLDAFKTALKSVEAIQFVLPNGTFVPEHFHVTEVGEITRHFIDCGGTERHEKKVNFQLWVATDVDHRLNPEKLLQIISLSEEKLGIGNLEIEVEYQMDTVGKFGLSFDGAHFLLTQKQTDCLALDQCGVPVQKPRVRLSAIGGNTCDPNAGCC